jgi:hypothetical protein
MLEDAIIAGDLVLVEKAINALSDPAYINKVNKQSGHTPLNLACLSGNCDIIDLLIDQGKANLVNEDAKGRLPLHCAAESKDIAVVERVVYWLTTKPAAVKGNWLAKCLKMKDLRGWTGFHAAIFGCKQGESYHILDTLLSHLPEATPSTGNLYMCQPKSRSCPAVLGLLYKAILCGSDQVVELLVSE